ncbi:hypothetical protein [Marinitoga sp. 38H-ov]|uniref:hypothetical protein n=1 Tax=Marinitoga sp. 38H-ov TaxID=1755814 RepID=UPI0013ECE771|nr:hypothetical protein [Marinitoga sp. 38H-ov]
MYIVDGVYREPIQWNSKKYYILDEVIEIKKLLSLDKKDKEIILFTIYECFFIGI